MSDHSLISLKTGQIKTLFQQAKLLAEEQDQPTVFEFLAAADAEFSAVAYEAVAMVMALKDLTDDNNLNRWRSFLNSVENHHSMSVHIGLGWALAQENKSPLPYLHTLDPVMRYRVLDGSGYYEGMFRHRQRVKNQYSPDYLQGAALQAYDQGMGRSLWYNYLSDPLKMAEVIGKFAPARHADLWRGVAIACTYVGGFDKNLLLDLYAAAKQFQVQLSAGVALAARSRLLAHTLTADIELACITLCNASTEETVALTELALTSAAATQHVYESWILTIEKQFISVEVMQKTHSK